MMSCFIRRSLSLPPATVVLAALALLASAPLPAAIAQPKAEEPKKEPEPKVTEHTLALGATSIKYNATAGQLPLLDDAGKIKARVFFVAYERADTDRASRPILFAFNGGPGSSSVWLHMGVLGPKRVEMGPEGEAPPPPGRIVDNDQTWLDMADIVFIDPVSTGYSRPAEGEDPNQFHGLNEDVSSVANFIRLYCSRYQRWSSPKFLIGESYGTTRASGLASYLQDQFGMFLNGIVLISPVLNFQTIEFDTGNDTPYWLFTPSYAATAWHHKRLNPAPADLDKFLAEVEQWSRTDYLEALAQGDRLPADRRDAIAAKLATYCGLSKEFVLRNNLRITMGRFGKELLRDRSEIVGRLDSRYIGIDQDAADDYEHYDPSYAAIQGVYTTGLNSYLRTQLGYESDANYEILTGKVHPWSFQPNVNRYANVSDSLRNAINKNPSLKVHFAAGYYDLATPFAATNYTVAHLGLSPEQRKSITQSYYRSGHMMYVRLEDLRKLKQDCAPMFAGKR